MVILVVQRVLQRAHSFPGVEQTLLGATWGPFIRERGAIEGVLVKLTTLTRFGHFCVVDWLDWIVHYAILKKNTTDIVNNYRMNFEQYRQNNDKL